MHKLPGLVRFEKLVQIKGEFFNIIIRKLDTFSHSVTDNVGHLIGKEGQSGQLGIGVLDLAGGIPVALLFLLIGICPVVDGALRELVVRQRLKRRTGKMQRPLAADMVKGSVGLIGIDALVRLIYDEDIPCQPFLRAEFRQLIKASAEVDGALQILQADKFNTALCVLIELCDVFLSAVNKLSVLDPVHAADKEIAGLRAEKGLIILIPGICDRRTVRHDEDIPYTELHAQVIGGEGFAKARLGIPQEFSILTTAEIIRRSLHSLLLLIAELVRNHCIGIILRYHTVILREVDKITAGGIRLDPEPLRPGLAGNTELLQVGVEVLIRKGSVRLCHIGGTHCPPGLVRDSHRVGLLLNAGFHIPLGKADLRPAVMRRDARSGIGIALRNDL